MKKGEFIDSSNGKLQEKLVLGTGEFRDPSKSNGPWLSSFLLTVGCISADSPLPLIGDNMAASISSLPTGRVSKMKSFLGNLGHMPTPESISLNQDSWPEQGHIYKLLESGIKFRQPKQHKQRQERDVPREVSRINVSELSYSCCYGKKTENQASCLYTM